MTAAIDTTNLQKRYAETRAVDGINLSVARGSVYGLLGPNGAGKTTTIRMLTTLIKPDGGSARVLGHDLVSEAAEVRAKVGFTGQFASVDEDLTGTENIVLFSRLLGFSWRAARERAGQLLPAFDLQDAANRQVKTWSGGMRRRLDIAASLIVTSELLVLDEPTTVDHRGHAGEDTRVGDDRQHAAAVPDDLRQQHLRGPEDHAGVHANDCVAQPGDASYQCVAGVDARGRAG